MLTFSHVAVSGDRAPLPGALAGAPSGQTGQADSLLQVGLPVELEQGYVVVQGLGVVVVVDVGGRHSECLAPGLPNFWVRS